jgi:hypothetical protein
MNMCSATQSGAVHAGVSGLCLAKDVVRVAIQWRDGLMTLQAHLGVLRCEERVSLDQAVVKKSMSGRVLKYVSYIQRRRCEGRTAR